MLVRIGFTRTQVSNFYIESSCVLPIIGILIAFSFEKDGHKQSRSCAHSSSFLIIVSCFELRFGKLLISSGMMYFSVVRNIQISCGKFMIYSGFSSGLQKPFSRSRVIDNSQVERL